MLYYERFMLTTIESGVFNRDEQGSHMLADMARTWAELKEKRHGYSHKDFFTQRQEIIAHVSRPSVKEWILQGAKEEFQEPTEWKAPVRTVSRYVSNSTYRYEMEILSLYAEHRVIDHIIAERMQEAAANAHQYRRLDFTHRNTGTRYVGIRQAGFAMPRQLWDCAHDKRGSDNVQEMGAREEEGNTQTSK